MTDNWTLTVTGSGDIEEQAAYVKTFAAALGNIGEGVTSANFFGSILRGDPRSVVTPTEDKTETTVSVVDPTDTVAPDPFVAPVTLAVGVPSPTVPVSDTETLTTKDSPQVVLAKSIVEGILAKPESDRTESEKTLLIAANKVIDEGND